MTITPNLYLRRHGGMYFWRVGRLGGNFYRTSPNATQQRDARRSASARRRLAWRELAHAVRLYDRIGA